MRVLIFHGYLLHGTGSNVYNASLAQALASQGHEVHLLCQDRRADELDWVRTNENITVHIPDIGGLLPVFVADRYEGFEVKTFPELTDEELDRYLDANVSAVRQVVEEYGEPDAALANHLIMGPVILARAGLRFAIKVHGSDLSYVVRPHPGALRPLCARGHRRGGGNPGRAPPTPPRSSSRRSLTRALPGRTRLGPPGRGRAPLPPARAGRGAARPGAARGAARLGDPGGGGGPGLLRARWPGDRGCPAATGPRGTRACSTSASSWSARASICSPPPGRWSIASGWRAGARSPRLLFIGFGAFERGLRELVEALGRGDLDAALRVAARGRGYEGDDDAPLPILTGFLGDPPEGYAEAAREAAGSMLIGGRLAHDEVADVMPAAETFAMTSTWPEAFGMVPAESAACGVPPVAADHSGMREVSELLAEALDPDLARAAQLSGGPRGRHRAGRPCRAAGSPSTPRSAARRASHWRSGSMSSGAGRASPGP